MSKTTTPIDWEAIKRDYAAGSMSIREMARWYSISDTAIRKRAKADGWDRAEPEASSRCEPANPEPARTVVRTPATRGTTSPEAIVGRGRNLTLRLLDELDATTAHVGELEAMIDMAVDEGDGGKQRDALMQALSLKQRSEVLKSLATAAKTFSESAAAAGPSGKKAERQAAAERVAGSGGKFAPPPAPRLVVNN